jgi:hypothetical protein
MKRLLIFGLVIILFSTVVLGQESVMRQNKPFSRENMVQDPGYYQPGSIIPGGLLDPSRFHMSHAYVAQFISNGTKSDMTGAYINTITYDFKIPLRMQRQWS